MKKKHVTIEIIELRQQELEQEGQEDELSYLMGLMGKPEMIERTVRREVERRWLALESALARTGKSKNYVH